MLLLQLRFVQFSVVCLFCYHFPVNKSFRKWLSHRDDTNLSCLPYPLPVTYLLCSVASTLRTWECLFHGEVVLPEARAAEVVEAFCPESLVRSVLQKAGQSVADDGHSDARCGRRGCRRRPGTGARPGLLVASRRRSGRRRSCRAAAVRLLQRQTHPERRHETNHDRQDRQHKKHEPDHTEHWYQLTHDDVVGQSGARRRRSGPSSSGKKTTVGGFCLVTCLSLQC